MNASGGFAAFEMVWCRSANQKDNWANMVMTALGHCLWDEKLGMCARSLVFRTRHGCIGKGRAGVHKTRCARLPASASPAASDESRTQAPQAGMTILYSPFSPATASSSRSVPLPMVTIPICASCFVFTSMSTKRTQRKVRSETLRGFDSRAEALVSWVVWMQPTNVGPASRSGSREKRKISKRSSCFQAKQAR